MVTVAGDVFMVLVVYEAAPESDDNSRRTMGSAMPADELRSIPGIVVVDESADRLVIWGFGETKYIPVQIAAGAICVVMGFYPLLPLLSEPAAFPSGRDRAGPLEPGRDRTACTVFHGASRLRDLPCRPGHQWSDCPSVMGN